VRPFKECHRRKQGQLNHPGEADEERYFRASGHAYGSRDQKLGRPRCRAMHETAAVTSFRWPGCTAKLPAPVYAFLQNAAVQNLLQQAEALSAEWAACRQR
jgi:hypothetical protein